jgi:redox-sensitive bicupin YhaK (pirin superfamily)
MSAGTGIRHSEMNPDPDQPVHFLQMWVIPDTAGVTPGYEQLDLSERLDAGGLVAVAYGAGHDGAIAIHQRDATMWVARLGAGDAVTVPAAPHVHVFVARGAATLEGAAHPLAQGDAVRLSDAGELRLAATSDRTEVVIWETA